MANDQERDRKLAKLESASERYVTFCGVVCFVAFFLLGSPALIAWGEAEPLMCRVVENFVRSRSTNGHEHPHSRPALVNYAVVLRMGVNDAEILQRINELFAEYGLYLG